MMDCLFSPNNSQDGDCPGVTAQRAGEWGKSDCGSSSPGEDYSQGIVGHCRSEGGFPTPAAAAPRAGGRGTSTKGSGLAGSLLPPALHT